MTLGALAWIPSAIGAPRIPLAADGRAVHPVVASELAAPDVKELADTLAQYLEKISGAPFEIEIGDGKTGLAVGTIGDFPDLELDNLFDLEDPTRREEYLLRSHDQGVYLIGATELAVRHAVWDFLDRLGYRHFFPGRHWEVIPATFDLKIAVDATEAPDFYDRRIWYGFGDWSDNRADKTTWDVRNRVAGGLRIRSGHAWDTIYRANKAEFDAHPEYLVSRKPVKFCVSNPGLRKLVVDWALAAFEKNPQRDSISLDPSDGDGWNPPDVSCPDATMYNSVSDRLVTLANEVAEAVNAKYPGKYVGIYAYFKHAPPPTIKVHPNVAVGVATGFIPGGYTFEQLVQGWSRQGATVGVREYYSVVISHKERPGGLPAGDPRAIVARIKRQHELGARYMSAESSNSWGPGGLGYYLAARTLWDTQADTEALINDFFEKAFGPAQEPMREYYRMIDRANRPLFSSDLIGRMYRQIDAARRLSDDPGIRGRLDDLALYTRYVELLKDVVDESGVGAALSHAYRIRNTHMVHSYALWRDTRGWPHRPVGDTVWNVPEGTNPWKDSTPFTTDEIESLIEAGIAGNELIPFSPVGYSKDLVPARSLGLQTPRTGNYGHCRPAHHFYVWVDEAPSTLDLVVTGGQVSTGGRTTLTWSAADDPTRAELAQATIPNDKKPHTVRLTTRFAGVHRVDVTTQGRAAHVRWPDGTPVVFATSIEEPARLSHRIDMYFYVPRGTKIVGGFADGVGSMLDGDGNRVFVFTKDEFGKGNYFAIPVAPGQDGRLWRLASSAGRRLLMTVPPYLARSADELMLPREVVEADATDAPTLPVPSTTGLP